eukprot:tig00000605_g2514.t1
MAARGLGDLIASPFRRDRQDDRNRADSQSGRSGPTSPSSSSESESSSSSESSPRSRHSVNSGHGNRAGDEHGERDGEGRREPEGEDVRGGPGGDGQGGPDDDGRRERAGEGRDGRDDDGRRGRAGEGKAGATTMGAAGATARGTADATAEGAADSTARGAECLTTAGAHGGRDDDRRRGRDGLGHGGRDDDVRRGRDGGDTAGATAEGAAGPTTRGAEGLTTADAGGGPARGGMGATTDAAGATARGTAGATAEGAAGPTTRGAAGPTTTGVGTAGATAEGAAGPGTNVAGLTTTDAVGGPEGIETGVTTGAADVMARGSAGATTTGATDGTARGKADVPMTGAAGAMTAADSADVVAAVAAEDLAGEAVEDVGVGASAAEPGAAGVGTVAAAAVAAAEVAADPEGEAATEPMRTDSNRPSNFFLALGSTSFSLEVQRYCPEFRVATRDDLETAAKAKFLGAVGERMLEEVRNTLVSKYDSFREARDNGKAIPDDLAAILEHPEPLPIAGPSIRCLTSTSVTGQCEQLFPALLFQYEDIGSIRRAHRLLGGRIKLDSLGPRLSKAPFTVASHVDTEARGNGFLAVMVPPDPPELTLTRPAADSLTQMDLPWRKTRLPPSIRNQAVRQLADAVFKSQRETNPNFVVPSNRPTSLVAGYVEYGYGTPYGATGRVVMESALAPALSSLLANRGYVVAQDQGNGQVATILRMQMADARLNWIATSNHVVFGTIVMENAHEGCDAWGYQRVAAPPTGAFPSLDTILARHYKELRHNGLVGLHIRSAGGWASSPPRTAAVPHSHSLLPRPAGAQIEGMFHKSLFPEPDQEEDYAAWRAELGFNPNPTLSRWAEATDAAPVNGQPRHARVLHLVENGLVGRAAPRIIDLFPTDLFTHAKLGARPRTLKRQFDAKQAWRIATWNARSCSSVNHVGHLQKYMKDWGISVMGVQSLNCTAAAARAMRQAIDAGVMLTSVHPSAPRRAEPMKKKKKKKKNDPKEPSARGSGVALLLSVDMAKHCFRTYSMPGRVVGCELRFADNVQVFVASVYLPPGESRTSANTESARIIEYMRNNILADWAARHKAHLFLLGDFNSCVCPATGRIRNARYASSHEPEHRWWRELLSESAWNLRDAAKLAGTDDQITFIFPDKQRGPDEPGPEPRGITATGHLRTAARLDYILQSTAAGAGLRAVQVSPATRPTSPTTSRNPRRNRADAAAPPQQRLTRLSAALDGALDRVKEIGQSADFGMYTPARKTQKNSGAPGRRRDTDPTPRLADSPWRNAPQPRWLEHYDVFLAWVSALDKKVDLHIRGFETKRILHLRLVSR